MYQLGYLHSAINSASGNDLETATGRLSKRAMPTQPVKLNSSSSIVRIQSVANTDNS